MRIQTNIGISSELTLENFAWKDINRHLEEIQPNQELLPGISWGFYSKLYTPAYWKIQYLLHHKNDRFTINYRLGKDILEEVVACLLGGFGLKAEIGLAAFSRLKNNSQIREGEQFSSILLSLSDSFTINGKQLHYRFPKQKAKFIAEFLSRADLQNVPLHNDIAFRRWLLSINGIGPKTASWITRNFMDSENVAIIDIHIFRAGILAGLFSQHHDIQKDYFKLEEIFIRFCKALNVQPSKMDALMWLQMKESNRIALNAISKL